MSERASERAYLTLRANRQSRRRPPVRRNCGKGGDADADSVAIVVAEARGEVEGGGGGEGGGEGRGGRDCRRWRRRFLTRFSVVGVTSTRQSLVVLHCHLDVRKYFFCEHVRT